jgi:hypothetical protein
MSGTDASDVADDFMRLDVAVHDVNVESSISKEEQ